jgi:hypothetical protein
MRLQNPLEWQTGRFRRRATAGRLAPQGAATRMISQRDARKLKAVMAGRAVISIPHRLGRAVVWKRASIRWTLSLPNGGSLGEAGITLSETIKRCRAIFASAPTDFSRQPLLILYCHDCFQAASVTFGPAPRSRISRKFNVFERKKLELSFLFCSVSSHRRA